MFFIVKHIRILSELHGILSCLEISIRLSQIFFGAISSDASGNLRQYQYRCTVYASSCVRRKFPGGPSFCHSGV